MSSLAILKEAFDKGYNAFNGVDNYTVLEPTIKNVTGNPYAKNSLPFKEFERGLNWAYFEAKKRNLVKA